MTAEVADHARRLFLTLRRNAGDVGESFEDWRLESALYTAEQVVKDQPPGVFGSVHFLQVFGTTSEIGVAVKCLEAVLDLGDRGHLDDGESATLRAIRSRFASLQPVADVCEDQLRREGWSYNADKCGVFALPEGRGGPRGIRSREVGAALEYLTKVHGHDRENTQSVREGIAKLLKDFPRTLRDPRPGGPIATTLNNILYPHRDRVKKRTRRRTLGDS
jgi:hypothetical protein